jgi:pimeloyl-ACP methyl ester carboxylesterase
MIYCSSHGDHRGFTSEGGNRVKKRWIGANLGIIVVLALSSFLLGGCGGGGSGSSSDSDRGKLLEMTRVVSYDSFVAFSEDMEDLRSDEVAEGRIGAASMDVWQQAWDQAKEKFLPRFWAVPLIGCMKYSTEDASGKSLDLAAMVALPTITIEGTLVSGDTFASMPILAIQHPTLVERAYSPSKVLSCMTHPVDSQLSYYIAALAASTGYAVVLVDYPGLGDDTSPHPYCQASLGNSVVDGIRATKAQLNKIIAAGGSTKKWNGKVYLMGFSEGGYATMVTAKQIQADYASELPVYGVAALDGPYSLSEVMRGEMVATNPTHGSPYFLPYTLWGYSSVYGASDSAFLYSNDVRNDVPGHSDYPGDLLKLMDGNHPANEISALMRSVPDYDGPGSILTSTFRKDLNDPTSSVRARLKENDGFRNWVPAAPMKLKMFHCYFDDLVPYANMTTAYKGFGGASAARVGVEPFLEYIPGMGSVHLGAFVPAFVRGFLWIDALTGMDRSGTAGDSK